VAQAVHSHALPHQSPPRLRSATQKTHTQTCRLVQSKKKPEKTGGKGGVCCMAWWEDFGSKQCGPLAGTHTLLGAQIRRVEDAPDLR